MFRYPLKNQRIFAKKTINCINDSVIQTQNDFIGSYEFAVSNLLSGTGYKIVVQISGDNSNSKLEIAAVPLIGSKFSSNSTLESAISSFVEKFTLIVAGKYEELNQSIEQDTSSAIVSGIIIGLVILGFIFIF